MNDEPEAHQCLQETTGVQSGKFPAHLLRVGGKVMVPTIHSRGAGAPPDFRKPSKWHRMASAAIRLASARFLPYEIKPGNPGTST